MAEDPKLVLVQWHADMAHLHVLLKTEGWEKYVEFAERVIAENVEALIANDPPGPATDWRKGYIQGLRRALQLPHEVVKNVNTARGHN